MGTEILNPRDCLTERARIIGGGGSRWRSHRKRGAAQSGFAKNTPITTAAAATTSNNNNNLMLGQVVILKRGESLDLKRKTEGSAKRTASASVPKQIRVGDRSSSGDEYAGAAFFLSPSPRALPLPSFPTRKQSAESVVHDSATKNLRRLLRLD